MANLQPAIGLGAPASKDPSGLRVPSNGKTIYHRPLNRSKASELSQASFAYLFGEMVTYAQRRVKGIQELEQRFVSILHLWLRLCSIPLFFAAPKPSFRQCND